MEKLMKVPELAARLQISPSTIYRDPARYNMFKVGGAWRANEESVANFSRTPNNVIRLAVVGKEYTECRSTKEGKTTGLISRLQTDRELDALLAPKIRRKRSNTTTR